MKSIPSSFDRLAAMTVLLTTGEIVGRHALNRLIWFADLVHFLQHGRTISGAVYSRWPFGPEANEMDTVRRVLIRDGLIDEHSQESRRYRVYAYRARRRSIDYALLRQEFAESELQSLKAVIRVLRGQPGGYLSAMARRFEPWIGARSGDDLEWRRAHSDAKLRPWMASLGLIREPVSSPCWPPGDAIACTLQPYPNN